MVAAPCLSKAVDSEIKWKGLNLAVLVLNDKHGGAAASSKEHCATSKDVN